jgi:hypothetical protein
MTRLRAKRSLARKRECQRRFPADAAIVLLLPACLARQQARQNEVAQYSRYR